MSIAYASTSPSCAAPRLTDISPSTSTSPACHSDSSFRACNMCMHALRHSSSSNLIHDAPR
eukprot:44136-Eustigmatos_ZCMA.PRE.1